MVPRWQIEFQWQQDKIKTNASLIDSQKNYCYNFKVLISADFLKRKGELNHVCVKT